MNIEILKRALVDIIYDEKLRNKFIDGTLTEQEAKDILFHGSDSYKNDGRCHTERADTMIGIPRLTNFQRCIETVIKDKIEGDIIETGVWKGGACILARAVCKELNSDKIIYVADSFEGLPKPDSNYKADNGDKHHTFDFLKINLETVKDNFNKYGLLDEGVVFIKGFFKDSLKEVPFKKLSVLRLDGDMYSSTWEALTMLYDKVSIDGFIIIDDYYLPACKKAINDFRNMYFITEKIIPVDWTGVYWRKDCNI